MSKSLHARLVAYEPFGQRIGVLPQPTSFDASLVHNDDGALNLTYSRKALGGSILSRTLEQGLEIALEVSDGGKYREPDNARYLVIARKNDSTDESDTVTISSAPSISWLLSKTLNNDTSHLIADGDNKGKRAFLSRNSGVIVKTMMDENRERGGAATGLTLGFDTGMDSAGTSWKSVYTLYYSLGVSVQSALASLVGGGGVDWRTSGRTLKMWNPDSTSLSRDLSGRVNLRFRRDVAEAPNEESISELASDILVEGDNGLIFRETNAAAPTPWGKWESYVSQGGVSDKATAQAFMLATLESSARVRGQYTRSLNIYDVDTLPLFDYHAGDWITAPTVKHGEKVRIQEIDISFDSTSGLTASVMLNDLKLDAAVKANKKIQGITGGATLAGSEGGRPAPEKDHRTPKAVTGLVVATDAYISSRGTALGLATLQWAAVSQATDDTAIDISGYRVEYRKNLAGAPWVSGGVTDAQRLTLGIGGLECGQRYEFRVRAVPTYSDKLGDWSNVVVALVASDVTPPSIPSKPILTSKLGVVDVQWDGRNNAGGGMELDFDHVEVGISDSNGNWKYRDSVARDGHCVVTGLEYRAYWFALRSVDHSGNKSDWGVGASITVASAVSQDDLDRLDKDLAANKEALRDNTDKLSQARKDIAANQAAQAVTAKELESAKSAIKANQSAIGTANATLKDNTAKLDQARKDIQANKSNLDTANQTLTQAKADLSQARKDIAQTKSDLTTANGEISKAKESAAQAYAEAHSKNHTFRGPDEPKDNLIVGDLWLKTQKYWTRWKGEPNNSPSMLADFYTYWTGTPNNSPSVLVPLSDRVIDTLVWDGSKWNRMGYADVENNAKQIEQAKSDIADNAAKTTDAKKTAENAAAAAKNAQGTADTANGAAKTAQDTANAATAAAKSATATAGQAKDAANAAQTAAESAKKTAGNAETLANTANASANAAKSDAASAKSDASTAKTDAANAKATASNASSVATQARATADSAAQSATDAANAAQKANTAAAAAAGVANGKADVLIQSTAPATSMRKPTTLWIDTTNGANTPKRWNGSTWMAVTDKAATDAANAAVKAHAAAQTAQSTADKAQTTAANAAAQANQAQAAAKKAQTTADGKNLIYRGPDEPSHDGLKPGDMWWRTQKYWTRWKGEKNASPSLLADFYTYWTGAPNASPSVLVPLTDRVIEVLTWDGTRFTPFDLVANNILAAGTVAAKHLAADSVTAEKVKANAITVDKLAANSVTTEKLVSDAVTAGKLAANSVQARNIVSLAITTDKLAANSVTTAKLRVTEDMTVALLNVHKIQAGEIAANAVTTDKLAAGAVNADKLAANSVTAGKVQAGAIGTDKLAANSVTTSRLKVTEDMTVALLNVHKINAGDIVSGAVTTDKLAANAVNADKLAANAVNADKIVSGAITADKLAANSVTAVKIAAGTITSDKVAAGQFRGYVFTGAIFQSSEAANTGVKLNSNALQMWDSSHNRTVYLDGEGRSNLLTGTFQTSLTGRRIRISPTFRQFTVGTGDQIEGSGIEFEHGRDGHDAYIASESRTNYKGDVSTIVINGGRLSDTDPGSFMSVGEYKATDNATKIGEAFLAAYSDYSKGSQNGFAQLLLRADPTSKYHTFAELSAVDSNGRVGVEADINSGYLYLGGFLGRYAGGRGTIHTAYFRGGIMSGEGWLTQTYTYAAPAKYGLYHAHVSADSMGSVIVGSNNDSASGCGLWARGIGNGVNIPYGTQLLAILAKQ